MKITFVGTSHGVPGEDRFCTAMMLESGGSIYFIDAGAPIADHMIRNKKDWTKFRALFTTHSHSDHTVGVLHFANLMNWYYTDSAGDIYITSEEHISSIKSFLTTVGSDGVDESRIHFKVPSEGLVYEDENIKVEYIKNGHIDISYSILVTEGNKRYLFGGDFSQLIAKDDVPRVIEEPIEAFVCEMAHFRSEHIKPYLDRCKAKCVFFIHVFPLNKYNDIERLNGEYPFEIISPNDGDFYTL